MPHRRASVSRRPLVARRAPFARTANNPTRNASTTIDAPVSVAAINQLIETRVAEALANQEQLRNNGVNGDCSQNSRSGTERPTRTPRECTFKDFLSCRPLTFKVKFATCTLLGATLTWWNSHVKGTDVVGYTQRLQELALMCGRMFPEESDEVEKYVGGLPDMIQGNVMSARPKTMQEAIELANDLMDHKVRVYAERQVENKRKLDNNNQAQQQLPKRQNVVQAYTIGSGEKKEYAGTLPLCNKCKFHHHGPCTVKCASCKKVGHLTRDCWNPTTANNQRTITYYECGNQGHYRKLGSFDVIVGMDWLAKYHAVIDCVEKIIRIPWGNETLTVYGDGSNQGNGTRLNIISCTKTHKYLLKGHHVFLANITTKETEDRTREKQLEDVPIVPRFFPEGGKERHSNLDPRQDRIIKDWASPKTPTEIRQFLGLADYYRRFIEGFSKIAKPMTKLTQKKVAFEWGDKQEAAFQTLKTKLCSAPILALPQGANYHCLLRCVHINGLGAVLMQNKGKRRSIPLRVPLSFKTIGLDLPKQILNAQTEAQKPENLKNEDVGGMIRKDLPKERLLTKSVNILSQGDKRLHGESEQRTLQKALGTSLDMSTAYHLETNGQTERTIQTIEDILRACVIDFGNGWIKHLPINRVFIPNFYHASIKAAPFEALYGRKCRSTVCWAEVARDHKKSYDRLIKRKPMEFQVGDRVMLKVLEKIGSVAYKLELPQELSRVHNTFHVSNLKKCYSDEPLAVPFEGLAFVLSHQKEFQKQIPTMVATTVTKEGRKIEAAIGKSMEKTYKANFDAVWAQDCKKNLQAEKSKPRIVFNKLPLWSPKDTRTCLQNIREMLKKKQLHTLHLPVVPQLLRLYRETNVYSDHRGSHDAINSSSSMTQILSGELADGQRKLVALALAGANSIRITIDNPRLPMGL
ncbi:putative reverse transcriptase domain-containing protein [Tanacetum coccineum]